MLLFYYYFLQGKFSRILFLLDFLDEGSKLNVLLAEPTAVVRGQGYLHLKIGTSIKDVQKTVFFFTHDLNCN